MPTFPKSPLFITLGFGLIYAAINAMDSSHFNFNSWLDPFYFSYATTSTVGYGDCLPRTVTAKLLVMLHFFVTSGVILAAFICFMWHKCDIS